MAKPAVVPTVVATLVVAWVILSPISALVIKVLAARDTHADRPDDIRTFREGGMTEAIVRRDAGQIHHVDVRLFKQGPVGLLVGIDAAETRPVAPNSS